MRDSESTLRRARREPAKAERRLRAKNRRGVSERGSETAILATGGKVLPVGLIIRLGSACLCVCTTGARRVWGIYNEKLRD